MEAEQRTDQAPLSEALPQDETHENAVRIMRERLEKDRRLREVARKHGQAVSHELHTSIGN